MKHSTPTRAIDALIGDEEQKGEEKKDEKEKNREQAHNPAITARMDHTMGIFGTPPPPESLEKNYYYYYYYLRQHSKVLYRWGVRRGMTRKHLKVRVRRKWWVLA